MTVHYNDNITLELTRSARTFAQELDYISRAALIRSCNLQLDPFIRDEYVYLCGNESARIREALVSTFYKEEV